MILDMHPVINSGHPSLDLSRPLAAEHFVAMAHLVDFRVPAGFPSPAEDHQVARLDLIELLSSHPQATYFMRIAGSSMTEAGIFDGDIVVINRALEPQHGDIVLAIVDNDFTCKRLHQSNGQVRLKSANPAYPDIRFKDGQTLEIWGVVTAALKLFRKPNW